VKKDKLLILDLDETLIYATESKLSHEPDFIFHTFYVYKRPYLEHFLSTLVDHYDIAVWSSASSDYVNIIVNQFIAPIIPLQFAWSDERCTYKRNIELDEYYYIKDLKKAKKKGYSIDSMLIVDNTREKVSRNYGNAIYPSDFVGDQDDSELKDLTTYLLGIKDHENLRRLEKRGWKSTIS
jgi:TFIIF-interacting CTD phosphatase-like protein